MFCLVFDTSLQQSRLETEFQWGRDVQVRLVLKSWSSYLHLQNAEITGQSHHTWLDKTNTLQIINLDRNVNLNHSDRRGYCHKKMVAIIRIWRTWDFWTLLMGILTWWNCIFQKLRINVFYKNPSSGNEDRQVFIMCPFQVFPTSLQLGLLFFNRILHRANNFIDILLSKT